MEFWRAIVVYRGRPALSFVSERGCVREWLAWHLSRGASQGSVWRSSVVSSASDLSCPSVWTLAWNWFRKPSGAVVWKKFW